MLDSKQIHRYFYDMRCYMQMEGFVYECDTLIYGCGIYVLEEKKRTITYQCWMQFT
jgi:hypothetical protein